MFKKVSYWKYVTLLCDIKEEILNNQDDLDFIKNKMDTLYSLTKEIAEHYHKQGFVKEEFKLFSRELSSLEHQLPLHFILENNPIFNEDLMNIKLSDLNEQELIEYIIFKVRASLAEYLAIDDNVCEKISRKNLIGQCKYANKTTKGIARNLRLKCQEYIIYPEFRYDTPENLDEFSHCFSIVTIGEKEYLVDTTYSQFFTLLGNYLNRLGIPFFSGCHVGIYMTLTQERKELAEALMRDGYIEATPENIKNYLDSFALSYRNGLYYEMQGEVLYTTNYTADDYLRFLSDKDNQYKHEPYIALGRQKKILKNRKMSF